MVECKWYITIKSICHRKSILINFLLLSLLLVVVFYLSFCKYSFNFVYLYFWNLFSDLWLLSQSETLLRRGVHVGAQSNEDAVLNLFFCKTAPGRINPRQLGLLSPFTRQHRASDQLSYVNNDPACWHGYGHYEQYCWRQSIQRFEGADEWVHTRVWQKK